MERFFVLVELVEIDEGELNGDDEHFFLFGVRKLDEFFVGDAITLTNI